MKSGTEYGRRVKRLYRKLRGAGPAPLPEKPTDPTTQLVLALLGWATTPADAARALRKLNRDMVDLNEVRVATVREIAAAIGQIVPNSTECARSVSRSLNDIFRRENRVSLDPLLEKGRREARQYLESLHGMIPYASASVLLWSLGAHAIPVSQRLLETLRAKDLVDPGAEPAEVQAFLERNIAAAEAREFCLTMERFADQHAAQAALTAGGKTKKKRTKRAAARSAAGRPKKRSARR